MNYNYKISFILKSTIEIDELYLGEKIMEVIEKEFLLSKVEGVFIQEIPDNPKENK